MKMFSLLLPVLLFCSQSLAQDTKPIVVQAGTSIAESVPVADLYQYAQFEPGKVFFKSGISSDARLNYNIFLDEMQFVNMNGDTLTVDSEETIRLIIVKDDTFYYDKGYMMLASENNVLKLAVKKGLRILDKQKKSAYNISSSVSSIRNVNGFSDGRRVFKVGVTEDVILVKEIYYYFGDKYNHFVLANKKNLLQLLPKHGDEIRKYLKENETEFHQKDDLEKLLQFLALL